MNNIEASVNVIFMPSNIKFDIWIIIVDNRNGVLKNFDLLRVQTYTKR